MPQNDPFSLGETDEEREAREAKEQAAAGDNKSFTDLRAAYNRLEKDKTAALKKVEELEAFRVEVVAERKVRATETAFKEVNLNPKHAELFSALNPELAPEAITKEAVAAFAAEYGLANAEGEVAEAPPAPAGFTPVPTSAAQAPKGVLSREDWVKLADTDPTQAEAAFKAGRVDFSGLREGLGAAK